MDQAYWHKQTHDKPLFPDLLWSRPENRAYAGKLLIIGGNAYGFAAPAEAYREAIQAGIGTIQALLPDAVKPSIGKILETGDFAPSTPSGSFSQKALNDFLIHAAWADGVLFAGDVGRNSETAIVFEKFMSHYSGQLTITKDAVDYMTAAPAHALHRENTAFVISFAQLQRMAVQAHYPTPFTFDMGAVRLTEALHAFTQTFTPHIITKLHDTIYVAAKGSVNTTKLATNMDTWRVRTAAHASVWWLQNSNKPFEALTTAVYEIAAADKEIR
jgi:ADP-dependent NAD(P)H-hydrate dehydratase / NAD(P)H-hydrate epimerase